MNLCRARSSAPRSECPFAPTDKADTARAFVVDVTKNIGLISFSIQNANGLCNKLYSLLFTKR